MAHPNEELLRGLYDELQRGNPKALIERLHDDVVWHIPGRNPLSGDHRGKETVLRSLAQPIELLEGGEITYEVHDIVAGDEHGIVLSTASGRRLGKTLGVNVVQVFHIRGGMITEVWNHPSDQYAVDDFWS